MGYEIDFLPVGDSNGDAICIRYGDDQQGYGIHVVDGAFKDTGEAIIKHIRQYYDVEHIHNMVLSHADNDHAPGLIRVLEEFDVGTLWMNRPWLYAQEVIDNFHPNYTVEGLAQKMRDLHPYLIELENLATKKGTAVREVFQGEQIGPFLVLAPSRARYIELIPNLDKTPENYGEKAVLGGFIHAVKEAVQKFMEEHWNVETLSSNPQPPTSASNESCVVQLGTFDQNSVLLTADTGPVGLEESARYAHALGLLKAPSMMQVPHHGSRHNVTPQVLEWWLGAPLESQNAEPRGSAIVSIGKNKDDYPRRKVANAFLRRGYPICTTRNGAIRHSRNMPDRGWGSATKLPFYSEVEE